MTKRPVFTEELRAVLLAHTFDAPEPQATIDAVLAETVGSQAASAEPGTRTRLGRTATLLRPGMAGLPRLWARSRIALLGGAVAAALVLLVVGAVKLTGEIPSASSKSAATGAVFGEAGQERAAAPANGAATSVQPPAAGSAGTAAAGADLAAGTTAAPAAPGNFSAPAGAGTAGGTIPRPTDSLPDISAPAGGSCRFGSLPAATVRAAGSTVQIREAFCLDAAGNRTGSLVQAEQHENATARVVDTLLTPADNLQVQSITTSGNGLLVRAVQASSAPGASSSSGAGIAAGGAAAAAGAAASVAPTAPGRAFSQPVAGTVSDYLFSTSDGLHFILAGQTTVAKPCVLADLEVSGSVPAGQNGVPAAQTRAVAAIRFTNGARSNRPCALSGYPAVSLQPGNAVVSDRLSGPAGGVLNASFPPTIVLAPGQVATAIVESSTTAASGASCGVATTATLALIGLPSVAGHSNGPAVPVQVSLGLCSSSVHPVVAGLSGSSR